MISNGIFQCLSSIFLAKVKRSAYRKYLHKELGSGTICVVTRLWGILTAHDIDMTCIKAGECQLNILEKLTIIL